MTAAEIGYPAATCSSCHSPLAQQLQRFGASGSRGKEGRGGKGRRAGGWAGLEGFGGVRCYFLPRLPGFAWRQPLGPSMPGADRANAIICPLPPIVHIREEQELNTKNTVRAGQREGGRNGRNASACVPIPETCPHDPLPSRPAWSWGVGGWGGWGHSGAAGDLLDLSPQPRLAP